MADIRDIGNIFHRIVQIFERSHKKIRHSIRSEVSDMGIVIDCGTATIDSYEFGIKRCKFLNGFSQSIMEFQHGVSLL